MSKKIPLTQGKVTIVDDEDFERLSLHKWRAYKTRTAGSWYAIRTVRSRTSGDKFVQMHREIMNILPGFQTDHINGDGLDNRKANLRSCTHAENCQNRAPLKTSATGFKGVWKHESRFQAKIKMNDKFIHLGTHDTPDEAARAYDAAARKYFGAFAWVNFPEEVEEGLQSAIAAAEEVPHE